MDTSSSSMSRHSRSGRAGPKSRLVVVCLGSSRMGDDSVGLAVARALRAKRSEPELEVHALPELDLSLIEILEGARRVILVDALKSGKRPGTVSKYRVSTRGEPGLSLPSLHGIPLTELFKLAGDAGLLDCPVVVIGIEPRDCGPGKPLSQEVKSAIPSAVDLVLSAMEERPSDVN